MENDRKGKYVSVLPDPIDSSITVLIDEFLGELKVRGCSAGTLQDYRRSLHRFFVFAGDRGLSRVQDMSLEHLEAFARSLKDCGLKCSSRHSYLHPAVAFFAFLEKQQYLLVNPVAEFRMPRLGRRLQPVPTESDMARLLDQPDTGTPEGLRDRALLEVAYSTGARLAELAAMDMKAPDLAHASIKVTGKGNKDRVLPLGKAAVKWLRRYLRQARPVLLGSRGLKERALWLGTRGSRLNPQLIGVLCRHYGRSAGTSVPITPHAIRRACATHLLAHGAHPMEVKTLLGHSSDTTLRHYLKVTITDVKKAHQQSNPGQ